MKRNSIAQVVLVDDDPDYAYLVEEAISTCQPPCVLKKISSGPDLFTWLENNKRPNVIFLDINMPGLNGFEVLKALRETEHYKSIPVVMLSVSGHRNDVQNSYKIGANSYITKPMRFDELKRRMEFFSNYWFDIVRTPSADWLKPDGYSTY